jgi:Protein of unknown function (DUF3102)
MVETPTPMRADPNSLTELATRIKTGHAGVLEASKGVVQRAISVGTDLIVAKKSPDMKHGMWLPWLRDNCNVTERHATRYMLLASGKQKLLGLKPDIVSDLTLTGALRLVQGKADKKDDGTGDLGKYLKAQKSLIEKKLKKLPPEDVEEAAELTIAELQAVIDTIKPPLAKAS